MSFSNFGRPLFFIFSSNESFNESFIDFGIEVDIEFSTEFNIFFGFNNNVRLKGRNPFPVPS